jgi:predicted phosphodiesterase
MRIAALYDVHGNLPALEAVLAELAELAVDRIVVGGDVIPGPMPRRCLAVLRALPEPVDFIRGNGENDVLATLDGGSVERVPDPVRGLLRWTAEALDAEDIGFLRGWGQTARLDIAEPGSVLFCHATPDSDANIFTRRTPDERVRSLLGSADADVVVCGHTHMQFDRRIGDVRVVNPGSVGMPFGEPGAYWALLGPGVQLRRSAYDLDEAARRIRESDYPPADEFADRYVLDPPGEEEMLDLFDGPATR